MANHTSTKSQQVGILDAGAQYGKVIDRRIRELAVESVLMPMDTPASQLSEYGAIIISGGPESVYGENAPAFDPQLFEISVPMLGICYGMQLMSYMSGGTVVKKDTREDGPCSINVEVDSPLFSHLDTDQNVLMTHGDTVDQVGNGYRVIAMSGELVAAIENQAQKRYGVQFHPEVDLTEHGNEIFANFLFEIAGLQPTYTMEDREHKAIEYIRQKIGSSHALVLVSGGVDSAVSAALVTKALGKDKVFAIHIDTGFMRHDESRQVKAALEATGLELRVIDASERFFHATTQIDGQESLTISQTTEPEVKRKIIGDMFMRVAEDAIAEMNIPTDDIFLVQGSLRPDLIESASTSISKSAQVIKTHHNDTALVRKLRDQGKVIEPLADYHKDEVRVLGERLGLPAEIVWRQPFPGPGLAIRILCAQEPYMTDSFEVVNAQLKEFSGADHRVTLLPVRTVGVQGDGRTYSYLAGVSGPLDWPKLEQLARAIPKKVHQVNRVVYIFGEPVDGPVTEITPTLLTPETITQLRQADAIVNELLFTHELTKRISQVPVILFPVSFGKEGQRSIGIRTIITQDFMTGVAALPGRDLPESVIQNMVDRILKEVPGISRVVYDLTSKPPGTTEWE